MTDRELTGADLVTAIGDAAKAATKRINTKPSGSIVIYFDTETGGVLPTHPTIQIAAVAVEDCVELSSFTQNIAFNEADCDPEALKMNHYGADAWKDAESAAVVATLFAAWLIPYRSVTLTSKRTGQPYTVARLAAYNAPFDLPRLRELFGTSFFPCEFLVRDVLQFALFHFDRYGHAPENFKLTTVARYFGIPTDGAHGALADARMCAAVHRALREAW